MKGLKESKYKRFEFYLRQCKECGDIFKAFSHNGRRPKTRLCEKCKKECNNLRLKHIAETKLRNKIQNELHKLVV